MLIDPRLNHIDDCLYRVAVRVLVIHDERILLVKESSHGLWALPGGGVDHGETVQSSLFREIYEEIGVPQQHVTCNFEIAYYNIGSVVNSVPRMNIYFKASVPKERIQKTSHVSEWAWFTKEEFLLQQLHASYSKSQLAAVIWESTA